ncbi:hypothetical protein [Planomonospora parontospora]|uniref:hypothetical protein n=1 Tax=Planomonospora parontospora TaxID=58119 RepID=UPI0016712806|nr:hypothetical protein [Planomonospora parontospora]GGL35766.1 hypothetical protein GCM10014719_41210 [Planomonospora parontospora subsp. antibiotica]GII17440.1 hypothetical protein Ppa05_41660 [Planomonospora parontospora subsp. antibiotica]
MGEPPHRAWPPEEPPRRARDPRRARPYGAPVDRGAPPVPPAPPDLEALRPGQSRPPRQSGWSPGRPGSAGPPGPDGEDQDLPPSARRYGMPATPSGPRIPRRLRRLLPGLLALAACAVITAGVVAAVLRALPAPEPARVTDRAAGVGYPLPEGWRTGTAPPVTGFTSAAGDGRTATVLVRPGGRVTDAREAAVTLADLYGRLLLHGDEVKVEDDRAVTVGGRTGHSRTLRAEYRDVVNRPAYLRVVFLTASAGRPPVVVLAVAKPDGPRTRAEIDAVLAGVR